MRSFKKNKLQESCDLKKLENSVFDAAVHLVTDENYEDEVSVNSYVGEDDIVYVTFKNIRYFIVDDMDTYAEFMCDSLKDYLKIGNRKDSFEITPYDTTKKDITLTVNCLPDQEDKEFFEKKFMKESTRSLKRRTARRPIRSRR